MMESQPVKRCFRIELPLTLTWAFDRIRNTASGSVVEIASDGLLFATDAELPPSILVTASIAWPVVLEDGCRLRLVVIGPLLRSGEQGHRMRIDQYIFRTAPRTGGSFSVSPPVLAPEAPQRNRLL